MSGVDALDATSDNTHTKKKSTFRAQIWINIICICAKTHISLLNLKNGRARPPFGRSLCEHASVLVCVLVLLWCHGAVAALLCSSELCEAASPSPSLSGPALPWIGAPAPICPIVLIVDHNAVTPVTFANNREINRAPPITHSASHPANEGTARGLFSHPDPRGHTGAAHPTISMTARSHNTHFTQRRATKKFFQSKTWSRHQLFPLLRRS